MENLLKKTTVVPFLIPTQDTFRQLLDTCIEKKIADLVLQEWRGVSIITATKETKTLDDVNSKISDNQEFIQSCLGDIVKDSEKLNEFLTSESLKEISVWINYTYNAKLKKTSGDQERSAIDVSGKDTINSIYKDGGNKNDTDNEVVNTIVRLRCTCIKELRWFQINIRIWSINVPDYTEIHIPEEFRRLFDYKDWLIILAWPTASGKTTAINAILKDVLKKSNRHLLTLEDPVEYIHKNDVRWLVTYRELGTNFNNYAEWVKNSLRLSPNLILIGEIRDAETANAALEAVLGWHLVISTIHTSSVVQAIQKFVKWAKTTQNEENIAIFGDMIRGIMIQKLIKGVNTEGKSRTIPIREIFYGDKQMARAIKSETGVEYDKIKNKLKEVKWLSFSMNKHLINLYVSGEIKTPTEVFSNSNDLDWLLDMIKEDKLKFMEIFQKDKDEFTEIVESFSK